LEARGLSAGNELQFLESSDSEMNMETYIKKCEKHQLAFRPVTSYDVEYKELEQGFLELNDTPILGEDYTEMFVVGSEDDEQRNKLGKSDRNKYIGQLIMMFPVNSNGKYELFCGSACLVQHEGAIILLTCAHNVCQYIKGGRSFRMAKTVTFYRGRCGDEYLSRHQVRFSHIHPHYKSSFEINGKHNIYDGVDIAICFLRWDEELKKLKSKWEMDDNFPRLWTPPNKSYDFDDNMKINVTGYPAESRFSMHQYSMDGHANEIQRSHTKELNGHILTYKDLDTTKGQSGSPVMSDNKIVGVHAGSSYKDKVNVATFITSHMLTWIGSSIAKYGNMNQHEKSPVEMVETKANHLSLSTDAGNQMESMKMDAGNQVEKFNEDGSGESTSLRSSKLYCCILL